MAYFDNVKVGEKVYGLVFGQGKVTKVFDESYYKFIVAFKNGYEVPYTDEGIPGWGNFKSQTIFYRSDIDLTKADFSPTNKVHSAKKIIKLREKKQLEMRLPSGIWMNVKKVDTSYIESALEDEKYHLFRKER